MYNYWETVAKYTGKFTEDVSYLNEIADLHNQLIVG